MTDRERLIEIIRKPILPHELVDPIEAVADYLLSNGVVVRDKGEWVAQTPEDDKYCWSPFKCNKCNMPGGKNRTNFCPNCGADLRRKNDI